MTIEIGCKRTGMKNQLNGRYESCPRGNEDHTEEVDCIATGLQKM